MSTKVRNTMVAAVVAVLASSAFALGNFVSTACIDEGASSAFKRSQQEAMLVSATPASIEANEAASAEAARNAASQATEQELKREFVLLGIWVD